MNLSFVARSVCFLKVEKCKGSACRGNPTLCSFLYPAGPALGLMVVQWTRSVNQLRMRRVLLGQCPPISVPSGRLLQEGSEEAYVRRIVGLWMWHWGLVMGFHRSDIGIRRYILDLNLEGLFQSGWFCGSTRSWVIWRASQCTCSVYSKILLILEQFQSWSRFTESGPLLPAFPVHTSTTSCPENICCAPAGMFSWKEKREIRMSSKLVFCRRLLFRFWGV